MRDLIDILARRTQSPTTTAALATIVDVNGSNYRRPGARMLIEPDGHAVGALSGGCLEQDIIASAQRLLADPHAPRRLTYDTSADGDRIFGSGTGCKGRIIVALERIAPPGTPGDWFSQLCTHLDHGQPCLLRSVVAAPFPPPDTPTRITPLPVAAKLAPPQPHSAPERSAPPPPPAFPWSLLDDSHTLAAPGSRLESIAHDGASWELFEQYLPPRPRLLICGATPTARPLAAMADLLGWRVTVVDWRPALLEPSAFPPATQLTHAPHWADYPFAACSGPSSAAVVMTHRWDHDAIALQALRPMPLVYLGLVGAKARGLELLALTQPTPAASPADGTPVEAPAGLDLGGEGPQEIALSIVARLLAAIRVRPSAPA